MYVAMYFTWFILSNSSLSNLSFNYTVCLVHQRMNTRLTQITVR